MTTPNEQLMAQEAQCQNRAISAKTARCVMGKTNETLKKIEAVLLPAVKPEPTFAERIAKFLAALKEDAKYGALVDFLDSINSIEELEKIRKYAEDNKVKERGRDFDLTLFDFYRENLEKFGDPEKEIDVRFMMHFPLTAERLSTPQKMRVFLRGASFSRVHPYTLAKYTEHILNKVQNGHTYVKFSCDIGGNVLTNLAFYTQLQPSAVCRLLFPGVKSGYDGYGVFFDFGEGEKK